jgi:hypothetical protein
LPPDFLVQATIGVNIPLDALSSVALDTWVSAVTTRDASNITSAGGTLPVIRVMDIVLTASFLGGAGVTTNEFRAVLINALNVSASQLLIVTVNTTREVEVFGFGADSIESKRVATTLATLDLTQQLGTSVEVTQSEVYVVLAAQSGVSNLPTVKEAVAQALEAFLTDSVVVFGDVYGPDGGPRPKLRPSLPPTYTPVTSPPQPPVAPRKVGNTKDVIVTACIATGTAVVSFLVSMTVLCACRAYKKGRRRVTPVKEVAKIKL